MNLWDRILESREVDKRKSLRNLIWIRIPLRYWLKKGKTPKQLLEICALNHFNGSQRAGGYLSFCQPEEKDLIENVGKILVEI